MTATQVSGQQAELFNEMTRQTISRYVADMSQEELLDLLGHIILTSRAKSKER